MIIYDRIQHQVQSHSADFLICARTTAIIVLSLWAKDSDDHLSEHGDSGMHLAQMSAEFGSEKTAKAC